jgi:hypothetical protein
MRTDADRFFRIRARAHDELELQPLQAESAGG